MFVFHRISHSTVRKCFMSKKKVSGTGAKKTHLIFIAGVDIKAAFDVVGLEAYRKTTLSPGHTWVDYSCSVT